MDERQVDTTLPNAVVYLVHIKVLNIRGEDPIEQLDETGLYSRICGAEIS
jgi:hypothetical protein